MTKRYAKFFFTQWVILGAALAALGALISYSLYSSHASVDVQERGQLLTQARVIGENLGQQLASTDNVLIAVRDELSVLPETKRFVPEHNDHLSRLDLALAGMRTVLVLDATGKARLSNRAELIGKDFSKRDYFERPRRDPDPTKLFVSPPFRTVLGAWGINLTRALTGPQGEFAGVVSATLDPEYFTTLLASVRYAEDLRAVIVHGNGTVFRIVPEFRQILGTNLAQPGSFFARHLSSGQFESTFAGTTAAAGERRMLAFRTIEPSNVPMDAPLVAVVSRELDAVFEHWREDAQTYAGILALAVLLSSLALAGFQRRQRSQFEKLGRADEELRKGEKKLQMVLENAADAVFIASPEERWTYANGRAVALLGYSRDELMQMSIYDIVPPSYHDIYREEFSRLRQQDQIWTRELRLIAKDGRKIPVEMNAVQLPDGDVYGSCRDITERKRAEEDQRVAAIAFETREGIIVTDSAGTILRVNRAFSRLTGYSAAEAIGKTPAMLQSGRQDAEFYKRLWETMARDKYWEGEVWNRRKSGEIYPEWLTITAVSRPDGKVSQYVAVFSDITEQKAAEAQIHSLAFYDPLTDLPNRRILLDRTGQAMRSCARHKNHGAVLFLDLDRFKVLNDTKGHKVGDMLLIEVARRLVACVRSQDTVARMGGDEFVVVLEELSPEASVAQAQAVEVAEKIRAALDVPYSLDGHMHESSPSIRVCVFDGTEASVDVLLHHADGAMYQAKGAGRNTVRVFGEFAPDFPQPERPI